MKRGAADSKFQSSLWPWSLTFMHENVCEAQARPRENEQFINLQQRIIGLLYVDMVYREFFL